MHYLENEVNEEDINTYIHIVSVQDTSKNGTGSKGEANQKFANQSNG